VRISAPTHGRRRAAVSDHEWWWQQPATTSGGGDSPVHNRIERGGSRRRLSSARWLAASMRPHQHHPTPTRSTPRQWREIEPGRRPAMSAAQSEDSDGTGCDLRWLVVANHCVANRKARDYSAAAPNGAPPAPAASSGSLPVQLYRWRRDGLFKFERWGPVAPLSVGMHTVHGGGTDPPPRTGRHEPLPALAAMVQLPGVLSRSWARLPADSLPITPKHPAKLPPHLQPRALSHSANRIDIPWQPPPTTFPTCELRPSLRRLKRCLLPVHH